MHRIPDPTVWHVHHHDALTTRGDGRGGIPEPLLVPPGLGREKIRRVGPAVKRLQWHHPGLSPAAIVQCEVEEFSRQHGKPVKPQKNQPYHTHREG